MHRPAPSSPHARSMPIAKGVLRVLATCDGDRTPTGPYVHTTATHSKQCWMGRSIISYNSGNGGGFSLEPFRLFAPQIAKGI
jgi:hypothetical protein